MKILVVDANALALDFCLRAIAVGHEVKWFIRDRGRSERDIGKGLVPKVNDWAAHMRWADLIFVPDNAAYMQQLQWYHDKGFPVYGATEATAKWELERNTGMDVLKAAGVRVVDGVPFSSFQKAAEYVKRTDARYVCKPDGDVDKALTYVAKSPEDMVYMLETWAKTRPATKFILQPFVPGIEMAVGAWVGPNGFASPWNENFEFKKLMPGDNGPATGEQGTVMRYVEQSKLADKVLKPLEQMLVDNGHIGYVDVNCIIDEKGNPVPLDQFGRPVALYQAQDTIHHNCPRNTVIPGNTEATTFADCDGKCLINLGCRGPFTTAKCQNCWNGKAGSGHWCRGLVAREPKRKTRSPQGVLIWSRWGAASWGSLWVKALALARGIT